MSSGRVVAGNVGTEARYEYTVIGPAVNEAARLTDVAKGRAVKVLASSETVRRAAGEAAAGTTSARWRCGAGRPTDGHLRPLVDAGAGDRRAVPRRPTAEPVAAAPRGAEAPVRVGPSRR